MSLGTIKERINNISPIPYEKEAVILGIIQNQYDSLRIKLNLETVPNQLEYIVVETSISRFNKIGSEGLSSENIDVISMDFIEDLFAPYMLDISFYISNHKTGESNKKVRFI